MSLYVYKLFASSNLLRDESKSNGKKMGKKQQDVDGHQRVERRCRRHFKSMVFLFMFLLMRQTYFHLVMQISCACECVCVFRVMIIHSVIFTRNFESAKWIIE